MFERFTESSRQVVVKAQEEAREYKHSNISSAHLLLGLAWHEENVAARVLASFDVTYEEVRSKVGIRRPPSEEGLPKTEQIPFTAEARMVLELALREALSLGHNYIGTEHLLLALIREPAEGRPSIGCEILDEDFNVAPERIRNAVIQVLSGPVRTRGGVTVVKLEVSVEDAERLLEAVRRHAAVPRATWPLQDKLVIAIHEAKAKDGS